MQHFASRYIEHIARSLAQEDDLTTGSDLSRARPGGQGLFLQPMVAAAEVGSVLCQALAVPREREKLLRLEAELVRTVKDPM